MHISMISAISNQGKLHFLLCSRSIHSEKLITFMEALIKTASGRKVYLILDHLKVHHSKLVAGWAEEHETQIRLFHLPPYSPENDPDEYLNHDLKQSIGSQVQVRDVGELEAHASDFMQKLAGDSDHVKAYFDYPVLEPYKLG